MIRRIRAQRFASERRSSVRFTTDLAGRLDGIEGWVRDLSLTGARIQLPSDAEVATDTQLTVDSPHGPIELHGVTRSAWLDADGRGRLVGFEFAPGQFDARARLALTLFGASAAAAPSVPVKARPRKRAVRSAA